MKFAKLFAIAIIFFVHFLSAEESAWSMINGSNSVIPAGELKPTSIRVDTQGRMWLMYMTGMVVYNNTNMEEHLITYTNGMVGGPDPNLWPDQMVERDGKIYIATQTAGILEFDGENWVSHNSSNTIMQDNLIVDLFLDTQGNIFVGSQFGMYIIDNEWNWEFYNNENAPFGGLPNCRNFYEDEDGIIWFKEQKGIFSYNGTTFTKHLEFTYDGMDVYNANIYDGMVYLPKKGSGGNGGGFYTYDIESEELTDYTSELNCTSGAGINRNPVTGDIWFTMNAGWFDFGAAYRFDGSNFEEFTAEDFGVPNDLGTIWDISFDPDGNTYLGIQSHGFAKYGTVNTPPIENLEVNYETGSNIANISWDAPGNGSGGSGGDEYFIEGFEGDIFPPEGWTLVDNDGDGYDWINGESGDFQPYNGLKVAASYSYWGGSGNPGSLTPDNYLISPAIEVLEGMELTWHAYAQDPEWTTENYSVYISTSPDISTFGEPIFSETLEEEIPTYQDRSFNLADYSGETIYVAFRHHDCSYVSALMIDDIAVDYIPAKESRVNLTGYKIFVNDQLWGESSETTFVAEGLDNGETTIGVMAVYGEFQSDIVYAEPFTVESNLYPPENVEVEYQDGSLSAKLIWTVPNNGGTSNPTTIEEDFEGETFPPAGWTIVDSDGDGHNWLRLVDNFANDTAGAMSESYHNSTGTSLVPDNYMITPEVVVGENYSLAWSVRGLGNSNYYFEKYTVYISDSPEYDSFTTELYTESFEAMFTQMEERSISLADYAGQTVYLAFRHHDCGDQFAMLLDDIVVGSPRVINRFKNNKKAGVIAEGVERSETKSEPTFMVSGLPKVISTPALPKNVTGYNLYKNGEFVETTTNLEYNFTDLEEGNYTFAVSAQYENGESAKIQSDPIFVTASEGFLTYGSQFDGASLTMNGHNSFDLAMVFDAGDYLGKISKVHYVTAAGAANYNNTWRFVEFDNQPTNNVLTANDGTLLEGEIETLGRDEDSELYITAQTDVNKETSITGKFALMLTVPDSVSADQGKNSISAVLDADHAENSWIKCDATSFPWYCLGTHSSLKYVWEVSAFVDKGDTDIAEMIPGSVKLRQNYPNPFNPSTTIEFFNNMSGEVNLSIFNSNGQLVKTLIDDNNYGVGHSSVQFDGSTLNSGVYFYQLVTPTKTITKKMILVK